MCIGIIRQKIKQYKWSKQYECLPLFTANGTNASAPVTDIMNSILSLLIICVIMYAGFVINVLIIPNTLPSPAGITLLYLNVSVPSPYWLSHVTAKIKYSAAAINVTIPFYIFVR